MDRNSDKSKRQPGGAQGSFSGPGDGSLSDDARDVKQSAEQSARQGAEQVAGRVKERAESMKDEAGRQAHQTADALAAAADELAAEDQESLAKAVSSFAGHLNGLASPLEHKSVDDLLRDAGHLAQRNPLMFVAGSVAAGVVLSRFFKARRPSRRHLADYPDYFEEQRDSDLEEQYYDPQGEPAAYDDAVSAGQNTTLGATQPDPLGDKREIPGVPLRAGESNTGRGQPDSKREGKGSGGGGER
jgi:hypothetical protein